MADRGILTLETGTTNIII